MKRTLALTLCLGIALPLCANADPKDKEEKERRKAEKKNAKIERMIARDENRENRREVQGQQRVETAQAPIQAREIDRPRRDRQPDVERERVRDVRPDIAVQPQIEREPVRDVRTDVAVQPQVAAVEGDREIRRRDRRDWNRERRGPRAHSWSYDEARRYHRRERRDRTWWRSNYSRFALFGGGYYYWDRGYWYPAYGYDPSYSTYRYDEPIYGYNQMEPRQVMLRVQRELRRDGYYRGALDGLIGPQTRAALARFQRDNGLYVTRRIDGPTLAALGVV